MDKLTLYIATPSGELMRAEVPVGSVEPKHDIEDKDIVLLGKHASDFLLTPYDSKMDIAELTADMNEDEIIAFLKGRLLESQREANGLQELLSNAYSTTSQLEGELSTEKGKVAKLEEQVDEYENLAAYLDTRLREAEANGNGKKPYFTKPKSTTSVDTSRKGNG